MRAVLFVFGTVLATATGGLLFWRPTLALALALLFGAIAVWRMCLAQRAIAKTVAVATVVVTPAPAPPRPPAQPYVELLDRIRGAGWRLEAAVSPSPWLVAISGGVRVAVRPAPLGPCATMDDVSEAMSAKVRERAQYAAIVCEHRPSNAVSALARDSRIHIVNLARIEAYLALAGSFKPGQPRPVAPVRVTV